MIFFIWIIILLALPACHVISVHEYEYIQDRNKQSAALIKKNNALKAQVAQLEKEKQTMKEGTKQNIQPVERHIDVTPPAVNPPKNTASKHAATHGFFIQLGAFRQQKSASRLLDQLHESWGIARIEKTSAGLHIVRIGPFASSKQAHAKRRFILEEAGLKGFVLKK